MLPKELMDGCQRMTAEELDVLKKVYQNALHVIQFMEQGQVGSEALTAKVRSYIIQMVYLQEKSRANNKVKEILRKTYGPVIKRIGTNSVRSRSRGKASDQYKASYQRAVSQGVLGLDND